VGWVDRGYSIQEFGSGELGRKLSFRVRIWGKYPSVIILCDFLECDFVLKLPLPNAKACCYPCEFLILFL
jgi:hypothetical protein